MPDTANSDARNDTYSGTPDALQAHAAAQAQPDQQARPDEKVVPRPANQPGSTRPDDDLGGDDRKGAGMLNTSASEQIPSTANPDFDGQTATAGPPLGN